MSRQIAQGSCTKNRHHAHSNNYEGELYNISSAGKKWNPQSSVSKPTTKKKTRTILIPAYKPPKYDNPRIQHITEMFLAPAFKNPKPQKLSELEDFRLSTNSWIQNTGNRSKDCTTWSTSSIHPLSKYSRTKEYEMQFIYSKLHDGPEFDDYEKQNFKTSSSWYRLREKQQTDFDLNFREDMAKTTKNERVKRMLDAVTSSQTTGKFSKQTTASSKNPSKKSNFLQRFSAWFGNRRRNLYRK